MWFRFSDVISSGDLFTDSYPIIGLEKAGSIQGLLDALNRIIDLVFPEFRVQGGTMLIPGHGRISDLTDLAYYRDMVTIVRDRVQDMVKRGMTLDQVKAAKLRRILILFMVNVRVPRTDSSRPCIAVNQKH